MPVVIVNNGENTPSGRKRWRWEERDRDGRLVTAGDWETNPARCIRVPDTKPDPLRSSTRPRRPAPVDDRGHVGAAVVDLLPRAADDLAPQEPPR